MIKRKYDIRAATPTNFIAGRIGNAARRLSGDSDVAHRVELAHEALCKVIATLYQYKGAHDAGRILIPLPWGASGWKKYGLRQHEARTLSRILLARQSHFENHGGRPPLFLYEESARRWSLNVEDWCCQEHALFWLQRSQITLKEWKENSNGNI